ncbi:uncharacterized protein LOC110859611 [Folsomia candida]|uniref:uncharacterized protein LOC110859611 n=1 Tax=Folsomia candida TaxID=158441 RepID=UPI000B8F97D6|nr:uncharacterized protein LOC110859611 [Folsomia candida]
MDRLRRSRGPLRASITRTLAEMEAELAKEEADSDVVATKMRKLREVLQDVVDKDQEILDKLLDEEATELVYQEEFDACQEYKDKVRTMIHKTEKFLGAQADAHSSDSFYGTAREINKKRTFKLPKIELKTFGGELTDWLSWWSQFSKIHEDEDLHDTDKFQYLIQATQEGSRARDLVQSYPQTAANYPKVVAALKERFGKDKLLKQVYVRELQKMVAASMKNPEKNQLFKIFDKLESNLRALESLGVTADQTATFIFPMVESSLPEETLIAWQRSPDFGKDGSLLQPPKTELDFLLNFLRQEVENEQQRTLAREGNEKKKKSEKVKNYEDDNIPTAAGLFSGQGQSCLFCGKSHASQDCFKAKNMSLQEKKDRIKMKKCCFVCLRGGDMTKSCKSFVKCPICENKHPVILCPSLPSHKKPETEVVVQRTDPSVAMASHMCSGEVFLQTLLVRLRSENGKVSRVVRLVFDTGAQRSVRSSTASQLKYPSVGQEWVRKSLFGGAVTNGRIQYKYKLRLESLDGSVKRTMEVLEEPEICGELSRVPRGPWIKELADKSIFLSDFTSECPDIEILIGCIPRQTENSAMLVTSLLASDWNPSELWNLESLRIQDPVESLSKEERDSEAKQHFLKTVTRSEDGRYSVSLPWTSGQDQIPNNRSIAQKRLETMSTRLVSSGNFKIYDDIIKSWEQEGIIEVVPQVELELPAHYLPHRAVIKEESKTTPVRPVFDASSKSKNSPSLNDCLEKGPNLMELIPSILMRFREEGIGVVADIRKAFLQISVKPEDRNFLRFLWWNDEGRNQVEFRHARVVFGVNCSPFLLAAVIENHLANVKNEDKEVARKLLKSMYVDNCVTSVATMKEVELFRSQATRIMEEAKMELRLWEWSQVEDPKSSHDDGEFIASVLGLKWDRRMDSLGLDFSFELPEKVTKRSVLSSLHKIYDPLGFYSPVLLKPKLLLQESWADKSGWEDKLKYEQKQKFTSWCRDLDLLKSIWIPRNQSDRATWQLHTFVDASKTAYAAVIFLRNGTRLTVKVIQALSLDDIPVFRWTDSMTALSWILRPNQWGTFVGNRSAEINKLSEKREWRHIPGKDNPADLPSRGCNVNEYIESKWWEGPTWLLQPKEFWPREEDDVDEDAVNAEKKKSFIVTSLISGNGENSNKKDKKTGHLSAEEINQAELKLFKLVQREKFEIESGVIAGLRVEEDDHVPSPLSASALPSPASPLSNSASDVDFFKQILETHISRNDELCDLVANCNTKSVVDNAAATTLINEFVAKLGFSSYQGSKMLAKAIIEILPWWKYFGNDGIDILYDEVGRSGLIQMRLRWIHRNLKKINGKPQHQQPPIDTSGPKPKLQKFGDPVAPNTEVLLKLNSSTDDGELVRLMKETLMHRNQIRGSAGRTILQDYSKFRECGYLINLEFSLMFSENEKRFLNIWPEFAHRLLENCKSISNSPSLLTFLDDDAGKWDNTVVALFVLLHLIPAAAQDRYSTSVDHIYVESGIISTNFNRTWRRPLNSFIFLHHM